MKATKIIWVDFVRAIACFMVVFLHSAAPLLEKFNDLPLAYWLVGNIYDSLVRVCVPLFFMISGYLLLQKDEALSVYFSKRFSKLIIPIVFWSVFFVLWKAFVEEDVLPVLWSFYSLILTPSYFHLWFLYTLIGLYLFVPILRKIVRYSDNNLLIYYCAIWFLAVSVIPFVEKITGIESQIDFNAISGYIGYLVLGVILGKKEISTKLFLIATILYLISVIVTCVGTYFLTLDNEGEFVGYLYSYLAPNIIIAAGACFILVKYLATNIQAFQTITIQKPITIISSCSFGIYLVHPVFLYMLKNESLGFELSPFSGNPLFYVPLTSLFVFVLSFLLIFIIKKIPILKLVAP